MSGFLRTTLAAIALVVLVTGCASAGNAPGVATLDGPGASNAAGASPVASALSPQDAALAYARCMRENGVDMPDPVVTQDAGGGVSIDQSGGAPVSKEKMAAADTICHHFMANAGPGGPGGQLSAEDMDKLLAFAKCMREHGVNMPDPDPNGGFVIQVNDGSSTNDTSGGGPDDPDFQAAQTACASLLPGKLGKPGVNTSGDGKPGSGSVGGPAATAANQ